MLFLDEPVEPRGPVPSPEVPESDPSTSEDGSKELLDSYRRFFELGLPIGELSYRPDPALQIMDSIRGLHSERLQALARVTKEFQNPNRLFDGLTSNLMRRAFEGYLYEGTFLTDAGVRSLRFSELTPKRGIIGPRRVGRSVTVDGLLSWISSVEAWRINRSNGKVENLLNRSFDFEFDGKRETLRFSANLSTNYSGPVGRIHRAEFIRPKSKRLYSLDLELNLILDDLNFRRRILKLERFWTVSAMLRGA